MRCWADLQFVEGAERCWSLPPVQTEGIAVATSANGYQSGPPAAPISFQMSMPTRLSTCPIPASIHTCFIGLAGAMYAARYPPKDWKTHLYTVARTKSPLDITSPTGGKIPVACRIASVPTERPAAAKRPATTANMLL